MPISLIVADQILTISDNSKKDIIKFYPKIKKNKIKRIYIGGIYGEEGDSYQLIQELWPDIEQRNYILYLGTMQPRKNIPALIKAYDALHHKYGFKFTSFPKLVIAGGMGYNFDEKINVAVNKSKVKNLIIFTGYINDENKGVLISNASVFIYPSLYEGFGIPPLEAMHFGVPTIVSNRSCLPEIVGDGAVIVDPDDCDNFCDQIFEVLVDDSLRAKLIENGKRRAAQFSWKELSRKTLELYSEVTTDKK